MQRLEETYIIAVLQIRRGQSGNLTLLHSERPKLFGVLAILGAIGLRLISLFFHTIIS